MCILQGDYGNKAMARECVSLFFVHQIVATKVAPQWPFVSQNPCHPNDLPIVPVDRIIRWVAIQLTKNTSYRNSQQVEDALFLEIQAPRATDS